MKKIKMMLAVPILATVLLWSLANDCLAATVSGTVNYSGSKTGRIYLVANGNNYSNQPSLRNIGVSIAAKGTFSITGLQAGTYTLQAFMDTTGTGSRHANDPLTPDGSLASVTISSESETKTGVVVTLSDPTYVSLTTPTELNVIRASNGQGAFVGWTMPVDGNGLEIPASYTIEWSNSSGGPIVGSKTIAASDGEMWLHYLANTTIYYYRVTANLDVYSASTGWVQAVSVSTGTNSISGTVTYNGIHPTGPLFVAAVPHDGAPQAVGIGSPSDNSTAFTIPNVPDGNYNIYAFIDMNDNGIDDEGDYRLMSDNGIPVTMSGADLTGITVPLPPSAVVLTSRTNHQLYGEPGSDGSGENYGYTLEVKPQGKSPVNAQVISGPHFGVPVDMGLGYDTGAFRLDIQNLAAATADETYTVRVTYSDASTQDFTVNTNAPLLSPPAPLSPLFAVPYPTNGKPVFNWATPQTPPAGYSYSLSVYNTGGTTGGEPNNYWNEEFPSTTTTFDTSNKNSYLPASLGQYSWNLDVNDNNGNRISYQAGFYTSATAPVISRVSPATANPNGIMYISGYNLAAVSSVTLGGYTLPISAQTSTLLTLAIPANVSGFNYLSLHYSGGSSDWSAPLPSGAPLDYTCQVTDSNGTAISGASATLVGNPGLSATTDANGSFTLPGLPSGNNFRIRVTAAGYQPLYTQDLNFSGNKTCSNAYTLNTAAQMAGMGITPGMGAVTGTVKDSATGLPLNGATLSVSSLRGHSYTVGYYNGTNYTGSQTDSSGKFRIINVAHGDLLTISAVKNGYTFVSNNYMGAVESITTGSVKGTAIVLPTIDNLTPASAKVGASVTIDGSNFVPGDTSVTFNGLSAAINSASTTQLSVTVPANATTGVVAVTTPGGTSTGPVFTPLYTLTAALSGSGSGSINSTVPADLNLNCSENPCGSKDLAYNSAITLNATQSTGSTFSGWSNCTTTDGNNCGITLTNDISVTAAFTLQHNLKIGSNYFGTAQTAFGAALNNETILARAMDFSEGIIFDHSGSVIGFKGGLDDNFNLKTGTTSISKLTIEQGAMVVDNLSVK